MVFMSTSTSIGLSWMWTESGGTLNPKIKQLLLRKNTRKGSRGREEVGGDLGVEEGHSSGQQALAGPIWGQELAQIAASGVHVRDTVDGRILQPDNDVSGCELGPDALEAFPRVLA
jgi:hypothetical protein